VIRRNQEAEEKLANKMMEEANEKLKEKKENIPQICKDLKDAKKASKIYDRKLAKYI